MITDYSYAGLAEAHRLDEIRQGLATHFHVQTTRRFNIPSFDFGNLFNSGHEENVSDELYAELCEINDPVSNRLPYEECAFTFRFDDGLFIFLLQQEEDGISCQGFIGGFDMPYWVHSAIQMHIDPVNSTYWSEAVPEAAAFVDVDEPMTEQSTLAMAVKMFCAIRLLHHKKIIDQRQVSHSHVNACRVKARAGALPKSNVIFINKAAYEMHIASMAGNPMSRSTVVAHDRRAHIRRLRSGKIVPVRASAIHGGAATPRQYEVRL